MNASQKEKQRDNVRRKRITSLLQLLDCVVQYSVHGENLFRPSVEIFHDGHPLINMSTSSLLLWLLGKPDTKKTKKIQY